MRDVVTFQRSARANWVGEAQLALAAVALLGAVAAWAQPIVYPARGQSPSQQNRDEGDCYVWAKKSTGIDPAAVAQQPVPQETGPAYGGGERVRGAARGALGGVAIGAIAGDAGAGAGIGAVVGTMAGGRRERQAQASRNQQAQAQQQQAIDTYYRAYAACMEGRGYTIR